MNTIDVGGVLLPDHARQYAVDGKIEIMPPTLYGGKRCKNCGGTGKVYVWKRRDGLSSAVDEHWVDHWDPDEGRCVSARLVGLDCPVCRLGAYRDFIDGLKRKSGVPMERWDATLGALKEWPHQDEMRARVAGFLGEPRTPMFWGFFGSNGVGKTMHLYAAVNGFVLMGWRAVYAMQSTMLDELRASYDNGSTAATLEKYADAQLLALDELRPQLTGWGLDQVREVLTRREASGKGVTLIAGEQHPAMLGDDWRWLASRMDGKSTQVVGPDLRSFGNMGGESD